MHPKLNIVVFINLFVILLVIIFHSKIEEVDNILFYLILIIYVFFNGRYIQKVILNEAKLMVEVQKEQDMSKLILSSVPTAIVVLRSDGEILYVNDSVGTVLGSVKTVGQNILEFDTVMNSPLFDAINRAIKGESVELRNQNYTSYTSRQLKTLNILCRPLNDQELSAKNNVMLFMSDITYENYLLNKTEEQFISMFTSFAKIIDAKDTYTGHHSQNVTKYVQLILENYDSDEVFATNMKIAATLHDIGKIGIPDYILNKPGKLTTEEYEKMKEHPVISWELLKDIEDYKEVRQIIKYHHERWDGKGYPDGLVGNESPIGSQIIAIADAYDAIVSDRVYRKGRSPEVAIGILLEEKGRQFNGELVDVFVQALKKQHS
jgi:HD-GYP domain-containing protein (c-di-GMP phosphodiesterase class II)